MALKVRKYATRCSPGALVMRDSDMQIGVIVAVKPPLVNFNVTKQAIEPDGPWVFEILIGGCLDTSQRFGSEYTLVQTW